MKIRVFEPFDIERVKNIHEKFYDDFAFPDFLRLLFGFIIEEEEDNSIVMAGGVELVGEAVLVTNRDISRVKLGRALVEAQRMMMFACARHGVRDLYAFVKNDEFASHLIQHGFQNCDRGLTIKVPNGEA